MPLQWTQLPGDPRRCRHALGSDERTRVAERRVWTAGPIRAIPAGVAGLRVCGRRRPGHPNVLPCRRRETPRASAWRATGRRPQAETARPRSSPADGRYVTFFSASADLVSGDTNGVEDCFVHDRETGMTERVSVASDGGQAGGASTDPSISGDGRYVAFHSYATTLVAGDTNGAADIFVRDRETSTTVRVSVTTSGTQTAAGESDTRPYLMMAAMWRSGPRPPRWWRGTPTACGTSSSTIARPA